jgi:hypothetical protein
MYQVVYIYMCVCVCVCVYVNAWSYEKFDDKYIYDRFYEKFYLYIYITHNVYST